MHGGDHGTIKDELRCNSSWHAYSLGHSGVAFYLAPCDEGGGARLLAVRPLDDKLVLQQDHVSLLLAIAEAVFEQSAEAIDAGAATDYEVVFSAHFKPIQCSKEAIARAAFISALESKRADETSAKILHVIVVWKQL